MPFNTLCVRSSIFERSRCQCSVRRNDFIYFDLRGLVARQSEQFCTYFSLSRTECGKPYRRALQKSNEDETNACKFVLPKKKRCMYAQFFFSEFFLNMHIASDTIFTIEGFILWPYSSQVTSSLCAKTVPRGGKYQIHNTVEPLTDSKGTEQKVRVQIIEFTRWRNF